MIENFTPNQGEVTKFPNTRERIESLKRQLRENQDLRSSTKNPAQEPSKNPTLLVDFSSPTTLISLLPVLVKILSSNKILVDLIREKYKHICSYKSFLILSVSSYFQIKTAIVEEVFEKCFSSIDEALKKFEKPDLKTIFERYYGTTFVANKKCFCSHTNSEVNFDFYSEILKICIDVSDESRYNLQDTEDKVKKQVCEINGNRFIIIPHFIPSEHIESYLKTLHFCLDVSLECDNHNEDALYVNLEVNNSHTPTETQETSKQLEELTGKLFNHQRPITVGNSIIDALELGKFLSKIVKDESEIKALFIHHYYYEIILLGYRQNKN